MVDVVERRDYGTSNLLFGSTRVYPSRPESEGRASRPVNVTGMDKGMYLSGGNELVRLESFPLILRAPEREDRIAVLAHFLRVVAEPRLCYEVGFLCFDQCDGGEACVPGPHRKRLAPSAANTGVASENGK